MDPLTAVGLASNVIQFVQFGSKLISEAWHIREHGSPSSLPELQNVSKTLVTQAKIIHKGLKATNATLKEEDQHLVDLALECKVAGEDFLAYLDSFHAFSPINTRSKRSLTAIKTSLRHSFNNHKIEAFVAKLDELRSTLLLSLTLGLRVNTKNDLAEILDCIRELRAEKPSTTAREGLTFLSGFEGLQTPSDLKLDDVRAQVDEFLRKIDAVRQELPQVCPRETKILNWLDFRQVTWRYDEVAEAYRETYSWVFEKPVDDQGWDDFAAYLSTDNAVPYFINGKAGSGKSTLMKFVVAHEKATQLLSLWAGANYSLLLLNCFFWNLGTDLQKSAVGMLRSLLYNALAAYPDLIPAVFPRFCRNMDDTSYLSVEPSYIELKQAFDLFVAKTAGKVKICIFIDGLDEYDGDEQQIREIGQWLRSLASLNPHVKVVVSSRPITASINTFRDCPTLRLQDLTKRDMELFIKGQLDGHPDMCALAKQNPQEAQDLRAEIQEKAQGVFLWVRIVVHLLITGLEEGDGIDDLKIRLRSLPPGLRQLYKRMFSKMSPGHRVQASQIFQLFQTWRTVTTNSFTSTVVLFGLDPPSQAFSLPKEPLDDEKWTYLYSQTHERIRSRCCGLLELHKKEERDERKVPWHCPHIREPGAYVIVYLHRTVDDFLKSPEIQAELVQLTNSCGFNPYTNLASACLAIIKTGGNCVQGSCNLAAMLRNIPDMQPRTLKRYLEELDAAMDRYKRADPSKQGDNAHWAADIHSQGLFANTGMPPAVLEKVRLASGLPTFAASEGLFCYLREFYTVPIRRSTLGGVESILHALNSWLERQRLAGAAPISLHCRQATLCVLFEQWLEHGSPHSDAINAFFQRVLVEYDHTFVKSANGLRVPLSSVFIRESLGTVEPLVLAGLAFNTAPVPEKIFEDVFRQLEYLKIGDAKLHESPFLDDLATRLEQCDEPDIRHLGVTMRPLIRKTRILNHIQTSILDMVEDDSWVLLNIRGFIEAKYKTIQEALDAISDLREHSNVPPAWDLERLGSALTMSLAHVEAERYSTRRYIPHENGKMHLDIRTESEERLLQIEANLKKTKRAVWASWCGRSPAKRLLRIKINQLKSELDHFTKIKVDLLNKKSTLKTAPIGWLSDFE